MSKINFININNVIIITNNITVIEPKTFSIRDLYVYVYLVSGSRVTIRCANKEVHDHIQAEFQKALLHPNVYNFISPEYEAKIDKP